MRLTKPPKNDAHAIFKYGVECGIEQERERIIAVIRDWYEADADLIDGPGNLIEWIQEGEGDV